MITIITVYTFYFWLTTLGSFTIFPEKLLILIFATFNDIEISLLAVFFLFSFLRIQKEIVINIHLLHIIAFKNRLSGVWGVLFFILISMLVAASVSFFLCLHNLSKLLIVVNYWLNYRHRNISLLVVLVFIWIGTIFIIKLPVKALFDNFVLIST